MTTLDNRTDAVGTQEVVQTCPQGRYQRYKKLLGKGSVKSVYKAFDSDEGVDVAWNQVHTGSLRGEKRQKFIEEVTLLQGLEHVNIIKCHHYWEEEGVDEVVFITEIMTSGTLKQFVREKQVNLKTMRKWARQILSALEYLHGRQIIHRDLKCDNIFINGNLGEVKLGDLGLSTMMTQTHAQSCIGTPEFMAPELYDEQYNEKVDIYAFGMVILEIFTNEYPFSECKNAGQIYKKVSAGKPPAALERIENVAVKYFIELCIDANGEKRPSAEQLRAHSLMADLEAPTTPTTAVVKEPAAASPTQVEGPAAVPSLPELPPIAETPPAPPDSGREISVEDVGYVGSLSVPEVMVMLPEGSEMDQDGTTITILHAQMETVPESGDSEPETGKITIDAIFDDRRKVIEFLFDPTQDSAADVALELLEQVEGDFLEKEQTININHELAAEKLASQIQDAVDAWMGGTSDVVVVVGGDALVSGGDTVTNHNTHNEAGPKAELYHVGDGNGTSNGSPSRGSSPGSGSQGGEAAGALSDFSVERRNVAVVDVDTFHGLRPPQVNGVENRLPPSGSMNTFPVLGDVGDLVMGARAASDASPRGAWRQDDHYFPEEPNHSIHRHESEPDIYNALMPVDPSLSAPRLQPPAPVLVHSPTPVSPGTRGSPVRALGDYKSAVLRSSSFGTLDDGDAANPTGAEPTMMFPAHRADDAPHAPGHAPPAAAAGGQRVPGMSGGANPEGDRPGSGENLADVEASIRQLDVEIGQLQKRRQKLETIAVKLRQQRVNGQHVAAPRQAVPAQHAHPPAAAHAPDAPAAAHASGGDGTAGAGAPSRPPAAPGVQGGEDALASVGDGGKQAAAKQKSAAAPPPRVPDARPGEAGGGGTGGGAVVGGGLSRSMPPSPS